VNPKDNLKIQMNKKLTLIEDWIDHHDCSKFRHQSLGDGSGGSFPKRCNVHLGNNGIHGQVMRTITQYEGFSIDIFYG